MSKSKKMLAAVIIYMSLYQMAMVGLSPVINDVSSAFPNASALAAQMASTFPALMMVVAALFTGGVTQAIGRKKTMLVGGILVLVAGVGGEFLSLSLPLLFVWAGLLGLGVGLFVPVVNSLMVDGFDASERSRVAGKQTMAVNLGGVALSLLSGILAAIRWNNAFLVFWGIIGGIVLCVVCLPNNKTQQTQPQESKAKPAAEQGKKRITPYVWTCAAITFLFAVSYFAFSTNAALLLAERGISSTTISGLSVACFMLGGAISGMFFDMMERKMNKQMPTVAFLMMAVSYLTIYLVDNLVVLCIAAAIGGASLTLVFPHFVISLGGYTTPETLVLATSLVISVGPNLGSFVSPLILTNLAALFGDTVSLRFLLASILAIIMVIILNVFKPLERAAKKNTQP
ncbi:MAG: MFS transporter [Oscillospiraceae bacterium]|nr:MFS transporter [Oscillospiraceae bacterium]